MNRRGFLSLSGIAMGAGATHVLQPAYSVCHQSSTIVQRGNYLENRNDISSQERIARIRKAQKLMIQTNLRAIILDCGTSMEYFTGIRWWPSERPMLAIIASEGDPFYICPAFEKDRMTELLVIGQDIFTWEEDDSISKKVQNALGQWGIRSGSIGIEERTRFFIFDQLVSQCPEFHFGSADPVIRPCRAIKSATEIGLMKRASDITVAAIKKGIASLEEGSSPGEFSSVVASEHERLGAIHDFALANFGAASAFPHGSSKPQRLKRGDIVLVDCGCRLGGYCSDISRTIVFKAAPTVRQRAVWDLEKGSQAAGFRAAQIGNSCERVDNAARNHIVQAGFGPEYRLPGLPHRTGHGIGMDGHEWEYMVKGNQRPIVEGMCFSIEPTIAIPGEFGIRLEDCVYMTKEGPQWFSSPSPDIEHPFVD